MSSVILNNISILNNSGDRFYVSILDGKINTVNAGLIKGQGNSNIINFKDALAFPGLFNAHDHLEFNLFPRLSSKIYRDYLEWGNDIHRLYSIEINTTLNIPIDLRMKFGMIKNLFNGITSVIHHGSNSIRKSDQIINVFGSYNYLHSVSLEKNWRIKLNMRSNKLPFIIHLGEGSGETIENEINKLFKWNLFKRKIIAVHGISINANLADKLAALIWCPDSNLFLYNKTANIIELKNKIPILFGSDSNLTSDPNFWNHIRIARQFNALNDEELINSMTSLPGELLNVKGIGKIKNGYQADIVVVKKKSENNYDAFFNVNPEDILIIIRSGKIILFDESLEGECAYLNYNKIKIRGSIKFTDKEIVAIIKKLEDHKVQLPLEISIVD
ncbi:MAG: 5'-deoxyadenosine deaminase [Ignavibacteriaceae bacterium]|nr:5'-deoxyadenosine deaminase [Ignavibacteriaceae bacterium]